MKKRPTYKSFNFDLDTNLMTAQLGDYTKGYYQIRLNIVKEAVISQIRN